MSEATDWADYEAARDEAWRNFQGCLKNVHIMARERKSWADPEIQAMLTACRETYIKAEARAYDIYYNRRVSDSLN